MSQTYELPKAITLTDRAAERVKWICDWSLIRAVQPRERYGQHACKVTHGLDELVRCEVGRVRLDKRCQRERPGCGHRVQNIPHRHL